MEEFSLKQLYEIIINTQSAPEHIVEANVLIREKYSSIDIFSEFFECIIDQNIKISNHAAVGFRLMCKLNWKTAEETENSDSIKTKILEILPELSYYNVEQIVQGLVVILTFNNEWPDLFGFVFQLLEDETHFQTAFMMLSNLIEFTENSFVSENAESLIQYAMHAVQLNQESTDILAAKLLCSMLDRSETLFDISSEEFHAVLELLIERFMFYTLDNTQNKTHRVSNVFSLASSLGFILTRDESIRNPAETFELLMGVFGAEGVNIDYAISVFTPLESLVDRYPGLLQEYFQPTIEFLFQFSQGVFDENECFDRQNTFHRETAVKIASNMPHNDFLQYLMQGLSNEDESEIFSALFLFDASVEIISDSITESPETLIEFLIDCLSVENHIIIEGALSVIIQLIKYASGAVNQYTDEIFEHVMPLFDADLDETSTDLLYDMLAEMFFQTDVSQSIVESVVDNIADILESEDYSHASQLLVTLNGAIWHSGSASINFIERIYPILTAFATISDDSSSECLSKAIECIGNLINNCYEELGDELGDAFSYIMGGLEVDDVEVKESSLIAAKHVVKAKPEAIFPSEDISIQLNIMNLANNIIKESMGEYEISDKSEIIASSVTLIQRSLSLMSTVINNFFSEFKENAEQVKPLFDELCQHFMSFSDFDEADIICANVRLGVNLCLFYHVIEDQSIPVEIITKCLQHLSNVDENIVIAGFTFFNKILKFNSDLVNIEMEFNGEQIQLVPHLFAQCISTISRQTPLFEHENREENFIYRPNLIPSVDDFLTSLILTFPEAVDMDSYMGMLGECMEKFSPVEQCGIFSTAAALPEAGIESPEELIQMAFHLLDLCDFTHYPDPMYFLTSVLVNQPALVESIAQDFVGILVGKVNEKESKARYYWETVANAGSGLLRIMETEGLSDLVDIGSVFPVIVSHLPYHGDYVESRKIIRFVLDSLQTLPELAQTHFNGIIKGIVETFCLTESEWRRYDFENSDLQKMQIYIQFAAQQGILSPIIDPIISNDESKAFFFQSRSGLEL